MPPGGGFLDKFGEPQRLPDWLSQADLEVYAAFRRTGFRHGLNWYRNIDRNWELLAPWQGAAVHQPALFIAGSNDGVIAWAGRRAGAGAIRRYRARLRSKVLIDGAGHWIQRERPSEVNAALLRFLANDYPV